MIIQRTGTFVVSSIHLFQNSVLFSPACYTDHLRLVVWIDLATKIVGVFLHHARLHRFNSGASALFRASAYHAQIAAIDSIHLLHVFASNHWLDVDMLALGLLVAHWFRIIVVRCSIVYDVYLVFYNHFYRFTFTRRMSAAFVPRVPTYCLNLFERRVAFPCVVRHVLFVLGSTLIWTANHCLFVLV